MQKKDILHRSKTLPKAINSNVHSLPSPTNVQISIVHTDHDKFRNLITIMIISFVVVGDKFNLIITPTQYR